MAVVVDQARCARPLVCVAMAVTYSGQQLDAGCLEPSPMDSQPARWGFSCCWMDDELGAGKTPIGSGPN